MEDLKKYHKKGDISAVCRKVGVTPKLYYDTLQLPKEEWTANMWNVQTELMKVWEERKRFDEALNQ